MVWAQTGRSWPGTTAGKGKQDLERDFSQEEEMKTKNILGVVALMVLAMAMPNTLSATACNTASTFQDLLNFNGAGGCTIGDLTFFSFHFSQSNTGTGSVSTASQVTIQAVLNGVLGTPIDPTLQLLWGFDFNPNINVSGLGSEDIGIAYNIVGPSAELASAHIQMNGSGNADSLGNGGVAKVSETDTGCKGFSGGAPNNCDAPLTPSLKISDPNGSLHQDYLGIGPYQFLSISKDINVSSNTLGGQASISFVRDAFDKVVPEPTSVAYVALGLLALIAARRRKQAQ